MVRRPGLGGKHFISTRLVPANLPPRLTQKSVVSAVTCKRGERPQISQVGNLEPRKLLFGDPSEALRRSTAKTPSTFVRRDSEP